VRSHHVYALRSVYWGGCLMVSEGGEGGFLGRDWGGG